MSNGFYKRVYGHDVITDFDPNEDKIVISEYWFKVDGFVDDRSLFAIAPDFAAAKLSRARIVYIPESGSIVYNRNRGLAGFGKGGLIADLQDGVLLSRENFVATSDLDRPVY
jgi:hypothetical protein